MVITICGSMKFINEMQAAKLELEKIGHDVLIPVDTVVVGDHWEEKKKHNFISKHMDKIEKSDAILVMNMTKKDIKNYVGANTFLEIGYAHYRKKKIYFMNPIPNQPYISDELLAIDPIVIDGKLSTIA